MKQPIFANCVLDAVRREHITMYGNDSAIDLAIAHINGKDKKFDTPYQVKNAFFTTDKECDIIYHMSSGMVLAAGDFSRYRDKMGMVSARIATWNGRNTDTYLQVQELTGDLNFVTIVTWPMYGEDSRQSNIDSLSFLADTGFFFLNQENAINYPLTTRKFEAFVNSGYVSTRARYNWFIQQLRRYEHNTAINKMTPCDGSIFDKIEAYFMFDYIRKEQNKIKKTAEKRAKKAARKAAKESSN